MSVTAGGKRLRARTIAIADPGPLTAYLEEDSRCFLHHGDGIVGLGEIERFETDTLDAADIWWSERARSIENETELPGVEGAGPLAFGSFSFDPDHTASPSLMVIPEVVIGRRAGLSWLTRFGWGEISDEMPVPQPPVPSPGEITWTQGALPDDEFRALVAEVHTKIVAGEVDRMVLLRDLMGTATDPIHPRWLVERLSAAYPGCWTYLMDTLVGAAPTILVRLLGGLITSRVLSGAVLPDEAGDRVPTRLANAVDNERPLWRMHAEAVASVAGTLKGFCAGMHIPDSPSLLDLGYVTHLTTDITGVRLPPTTSLGLAATLHPTRAMCGSPVAAARDLISEVEPIDRGRFAGPIGWIDSRGNGEWSVAMRGARLVGEHGAQALASASVRADTTVDFALAETAAKFTPTIEALG